MQVASCFQQCHGSPLDVYRPDIAQFVAENIWHYTFLKLLDLSWLGYKLLFVRQDPSSITLSGKASHGRSCHLEADLFLRLTDSAPFLSACLFLSIWISLSISLFLSLQPLSLQSVWIKLLRQASLIFNQFQEQHLSALSAPLPVCQSSEHPLLEGGSAEPIRDTKW